jgi:hypothetical protein
MAAGRTRAAMELKVYQKLLSQNNANIERVKAEIAEYEEIQRLALVRRKEFSARTVEVDRARRELALYQGYADQVGRVLTAENSQRGILFEKIKPAIGSGIPTSPRLSTIIVLSLTVGLAASVVLVLVSELFDGTIRTRRQVTSALGLPILESIGEIVTSATRRKRLLMRTVLAPAVICVLIGLVVVSGSMAYLSLRDRSLYERTMTWPKSAWRRIVEQSFDHEPVALADGPFEEHRG